jgi:PRTRC genetic system ThiF family protein
MGQDNGENRVIHYISEELLNKTSQRIIVMLIGCGGTGSRMLNNLARLNITLRGLQRPELYVVAFDPDVVEEHNVGRQLFFPDDVGLFKSEVLIERLNLAYGLDWLSVPSYYSRTIGDSYSADIYITCTDNIPSRRLIYNQMKQNNKYWLDLGNTKSAGQIFLRYMKYNDHARQLKSVYEYLKKSINLFNKKDDDGPSCSLAVALNKQSLFINSILAEYASIMLYDLLVNYRLDYNGIFIDLDRFEISKAPIRLDRKT